MRLEAAFSDLSESTLKMTYRRKKVTTSPCFSASVTLVNNAPVGRWVRFVIRLRR